MKYENNFKSPNIFYVAVTIFQYSNQSQQNQAGIMQRAFNNSFHIVYLKQGCYNKSNFSSQSAAYLGFGFQRPCKSFIANKQIPRICTVKELSYSPGKLC